MSNVNPKINKEIMEDANVKNARQQMIDAMITYLVAVMTRAGVHDVIQNVVVNSVTEEVPNHLDSAGHGTNYWWDLSLSLIKLLDTAHSDAFADDEGGIMLREERLLLKYQDFGFENDAWLTECYNRCRNAVLRHHEHRLHLLLSDRPGLADEICKWADLRDGEWRINAANSLIFRGEVDAAEQVLSDPLCEVQIAIIGWQYALSEAAKKLTTNN